MESSEPKIQTKWLGILVSILLSLIVGLIWWILNNKEQSDYVRLVKTESDRLASNITVDLKSRISSVQRIVSRWEFNKGTPKEVFINDAQQYIYDMPGFKAISWVDRNYYARWIIPLEENREAVNLNLAFEKKRLEALEKAKNRRSPTMTAPINLVTGGMGFQIYFPIFVNGNFDGFILAVFNIEEWLNHIFDVKNSQEEIKNYRFTVTMDDLKVLKQPVGELNRTDFETVSSTTALSHSFLVRVQPTDFFFKKNHTITNYIIITGGFILSFIIGFMIFLSQKTTEEAWRSHTARVSLERALGELSSTKDELQVVNQRLTLAAKAGKIGIWAWNIATNKLSWNDVMYELYDIPPDVTPRYETWHNLLIPEDIEKVEAKLSDALEGRAAFNTEFRILHTDGKIEYIRAAAKIERDNQSAPYRMTGVNWNITEIREAEKQLALERRRLSYILEGTNAGTWEWDIQADRIIINERWADMIGYRTVELSPLSITGWKALLHPEDIGNMVRTLADHFEREIDYYSCEMRMLHKNGKLIWVLVRGRIAKWSEDGKPLIMSGTNLDISVQKEAEEKILHMATHDALTGLPSLTLVLDRVQMSIQISERNHTSSAVMFVDLDGFKNINDTFGHDAGNAVLKVVSQRLLSCARKTDTVARIGGDEFLVVLSELHSDENSEIVAEKIIKTISGPITFKNNELHVGASIGIAIYPGDGEDVESLIKAADGAMYRVKSSGKNGFRFASP